MPLLQPQPQRNPIPEKKVKKITLSNKGTSTGDNKKERLIDVLKKNKNKGR